MRAEPSRASCAPGNTSFRDPGKRDPRPQPGARPMEFALCHPAPMNHLRDNGSHEHLHPNSPIAEASGSQVTVHSVGSHEHAQHNVSGRIHRAQTQAHARIPHLKAFGISHRSKAPPDSLHRLFCKNNHKIV